MKYSKKIHLDPTKVTPLGIIRYAEEYFLSSVVVEKHLGKHFNLSQIPAVPALYLAGHSIELAFKAYLLKHGIKLDKLISDCGHDLEKCYKNAKCFKIDTMFSPTVAELGAFELLDSLYSTKQLDYIVTGQKLMPLFPLIESFLKKLLAVVSSEIGYKLDSSIKPNM